MEYTNHSAFFDTSSYHNRNEIKTTLDTNDQVHTTNSYLTSKQLQQLLNIVTVVKPVKNGRITFIRNAYAVCRRQLIKQKQESFNFILLTWTVIGLALDAT